jgi:two-component system, NtrC family, nitrogen regulation sensor histidine kinase NtrY
MNKLKMKGKNFLVILTALTGVFILASVIAGSVYSGDLEYRLRTKKFNRILSGMEKLTGDCLNSLKIRFESGIDTGSVFRTDLFRSAGEKGITFLDYFDNKLVYWSDNSFDIPLVYDDSLFTKKLLFIHNGWFISKSLQVGNEKFIAMLRIRNDYGFENDIVKSGFTDQFDMPEGTAISFEKSASGFNVTDSDGTWLFSLIYPDKKEPSFYIVLPVMLWAISLILILILVIRVAALLAEREKQYLSVLLSFFILAAIYAAVFITHKPSVFFLTGLFSGYRFSLTWLIPSLGHLLIFSVALAVFSLIFYKNFPIKIHSEKGRMNDWLILTMLLAVVAVMFLVWNHIFRNLVLDSNVNFEPYKVLDLTFNSFAGFASVFLLLMVPLFFMLKIFTCCVETGSRTVMISVGCSLVVFVVAAMRGSEEILPTTLLYVSLAVSLWFTMRRMIGRFNMTVLFSLLFGLCSLWYILFLSEQKNIENKKIMAVAYSSEHDPEAEHLLIDIWPGISTDTFIKDMLLKDQLLQDDIDNLTAYLHDRWFKGYWGNFNLSTVTCSNDSPLWIKSDETLVDNCFQFFNDRISKYGHQLTGTGFWFLDNQGGRSYYIGQLFFDLPDGRKNGLFIDLYSDVDAFQAGYSELLLDKKYQGYGKLKDYSFAKYINGNLVLRTGDFPYDKSDGGYIEKGNDYRIFNREGFKHVLYKNGNVTVMISEKRVSATDVIISFAYLFAFILLLSNLLLLLASKPRINSLLYFSFRQKLQISFIAILLFSFISVGVVIAFFSVKQYETRHLENIKERINSIYIELGNKLSMEQKLTADWRNENYPSLNEFLISLSNIFNTDINLYTPQGYLMATSRPEVFYRDLTSRRLNMAAFINLENLTKSEYIQKEKIASLEFVSAYVPFYNDSDELLGYLNLPYFRMQSVLARDISNVIVAVINFTLLLIIITMVIAVIISGTLTAPLRMLSEGLATVELGKKSEHLSYEGHDEVSDIVKQYNRMVDELQESAAKLANSEREYAWREMAKQVAHEIKNPLTPMKLNIQQLYKSWKDGIPGFEKKLELFTKNQIENIETLSSIASAFSSFAKMPVASPVDINLTDQIRATLELFRGAENTRFRVNWPHECRIMVHMDKEHLSGIFSNLIKNAIQSVPPGREGIIGVNVELKGDRVVISVTDNGSGIPDEVKKNLFTPNFTTKSSGMGLGLSIVKRFAENANGRVWFESEINKGSSFFVELPVIFTVERL